MRGLNPAVCATVWQAFSECCKHNPYKLFVARHGLEHISCAAECQPFGSIVIEGALQNGKTWT